jgi:hypothetical protein
VFDLLDWIIKSAFACAAAVEEEEPDVRLLAEVLLSLAFALLASNGPMSVLSIGFVVLPGGGLSNWLASLSSLSLDDSSLLLPDSLEACGCGRRRAAAGSSTAAEATGRVVAGVVEVWPKKRLRNPDEVVLVAVEVGTEAAVVNRCRSSSVENAAPVFRTGDERDDVLPDEPDELLLSLLTRRTLVWTDELLSQPAVMGGVDGEQGIESVF